MKERNLILVRHGQSEWNEKNLFTGWENPGLTKKGLDEAKNAGILIDELDIEFHCMFTSALIRAFAKIVADRGVNSAVLIIVELPVANEHDKERPIIAKG